MTDQKFTRAFPIPLKPDELDAFNHEGNLNAVRIDALNAGLVAEGEPTFDGADERGSGSMLNYSLPVSGVPEQDVKEVNPRRTLGGEPFEAAPVVEDHADDVEDDEADDTAGEQ